MSAPIKNVTLIGGNGSLGTVVLSTLLAAGCFRVTVIKRASSTSVSKPSSLPPPRIVTVSDDFTTAELTEAFRGEDAVISCFPLRDLAAHFRLCDAAFAAETVRRFIPADFGSVDARSPRARELVKLFDNKVKVREHLEALCTQSSGRLTWTSLVAGHLFDWGLNNGFLHFYPDKKRAEILGDGLTKSSNSTLAQVGKAVVAILQRLAETENRVLMIQSFCVSQVDVLRSLEKATGGDEWKDVEYIDIDSFVAKHKSLVDSGNRQSIEDLVFALGVIEGNWEEKDDFAMDLLGLENEDLDQVVQAALAEAS
jgi:hypothetical protein